MDHFPAQMSGGEQQRVAIARAIAKRPDVLLCDEPTGALDSKTGIRVLEALSQVNRELGTTTALITHNAAIKDMAHRVLLFGDGRITGTHDQRIAQAALGDQLVSPMRMLDRKLLRDLRRMWAQALAIALVMASGVATYVLASGAYHSLDETRQAYYLRYRFADVFAQVRRAPKSVAEQIAAISGVAAAEPRITHLSLLDVEGLAEPASGMAVSIPDLREPRLNLPHLREGRLPERARTDEVTVNEAFAKAHRMQIGSTFKALLNGKKRELKIVGVALSPEFIYALGPGDLMPDDRRFAVLWMSEKALAALFDLDGAFNAVSLKLLPGGFRGRGHQAGRRLAGALRRHRRLRPQGPALARLPRCRAAPARCAAARDAADLPAGLGLPHQHHAVAHDRAGARADRPPQGARLRPAADRRPLRQDRARDHRSSAS